MQRSVSFSGTKPIRRRRSSIKRSKSLQKSCHPLLEEKLFFKTRRPFSSEVSLHSGSSPLCGTKPAEIDIEVGVPLNKSVVSSDMSIPVDPPSQTDPTGPVVTLDPEEGSLLIERDNGFIESTDDNIIEALKESSTSEAAALPLTNISQSPQEVQSDEYTQQPIPEPSISFSPKAFDFQEQESLEKEATEINPAHTSVFDPDPGVEDIPDSKSPILMGEPVIDRSNEVFSENLQQQTVLSTIQKEHHGVSYDDGPGNLPIKTPQIDESITNSQLLKRSISIPGSSSPNHIVQSDLKLEEAENHSPASSPKENEHHESIDRLNDSSKKISVMTEEAYEDFSGQLDLNSEVVAREGQDLICFSPGATLLHSPEHHTLIDIGFKDVQKVDINSPKVAESSITDQDQITNSFFDSREDELCTDEESDSDHSTQDEVSVRPIGRFSALMPTNKPLQTETNVDVSVVWPVSQNTNESPVYSLETSSHDQLMPSSPVSKKRKISTPLDRNPIAIKKLKQPFKCPLITEKAPDKLIVPDSSQPSANSPASSSPTPQLEPQPTLVQRSRPLSFKPLTIRPAVQYQTLRDKLGLCSTSKDQDDKSTSDSSSALEEPDLEVKIKSKLMSRRNPFVTLKASAPFVSPVTASSSSSTKETTLSTGSVGKITQREVAKLESKVQMIKQAIRLVKGEGKRQEEKQDELIIKWKDAGREISQLLWDEGGSANPADTFQPFESSPFSSSPPKSSFFPSDTFSSFPRQSFFSNSIFSDASLLANIDHSTDRSGASPKRERSLSLESPMGSPSSYRPSRSGQNGLGISARRQVRGYLESFDKARSEKKDFFDQSHIGELETTDGREKEEEERKEAKEEDEEEEDKGWDIGKMLRTVFRTDPTLFGWNDSIVDWDE